MHAPSFIKAAPDISKRYLKARREYKKAPLFAYDIMCRLYPDYSYEQFLNDIKLKRRKKLSTPQQWAQYGRYGQIKNLVAKYCRTGRETFLKAARKLRKEITHPYSVTAKTPSGYMAFTFSAATPIKEIEKLVRKINACKTSAKVLKVVADFEQLQGKQ